jgi:A/G-specific adenine glycosylase
MNELARSRVAGTARAGVQAALLAWTEETLRDLPWRRTRDPWAILVSELMLQQTQVARVQPRYHAFLERFPTPGSCASAPVGAVVELWAGLGYNRRAVNLQRCAVAVVDRHGGSLPDTIDDLLALPGVGPYTARAVLAFAFERDVGVLDTNAARVLARVEGRSLGRADAQRLADALVPRASGWRWNQSMLDLGATICSARAPGCPVCPLRAHCAWARAGRAAPDPAIGSAGVSGRQSRFEGSDRQGRGRLVRALCLNDGDGDGGVAVADLPSVAGWPEDQDRSRRAADSLVHDGLARWDGDRLRLP